MKYRLSDSVEVFERGGEFFLVSKAPVRVLRINRTLADLLMPAVRPIAPDTPEVGAIFEQLAEKGFLEKVREADERSGYLPTVSVVIPVKDRADELERCLESVLRVDYPQGKLQVIVVDDGSSDGSADVARRLGARVIASGGTGRGPAAARNVGAAYAEGEILAFIDSDCTAATEWLTELIPYFEKPEVGAVGGLVDGMTTSSAIDRYEAVMSSLALGSRERTGSDGDDTFYLPSCNLLVRRIAFQLADGFEDSMHVGEDVDLTWRLRDNGWTIAYVPAGRVCHEHRSTVRSFMSRRFDYGTSEGMLQLLHPNRRKQMVVPPLLGFALALLIAALFAGWWLVAFAAATLVVDATVLRLRLRRRSVPLGFAALAGGRLRALGSLIYYVCYHLIRYYATPLMVVSLVLPIIVPFFLGVLGCTAGVDYLVRKPRLAFPLFVLVYLLEQTAYGAGVFWGCLTRRCFSSYRVAVVGHTTGLVD